MGKIFYLDNRFYIHPPPDSLGQINKYIPPRHGAAVPSGRENPVFPYTSSLPGTVSSGEPLPLPTEILYHFPSVSSSTSPPAGFPEPFLGAVRSMPSFDFPAYWCLSPLPAGVRFCPPTGRAFDRISPQAIQLGWYFCMMPSIISCFSAYATLRFPFSSTLYSS